MTTPQGLPLAALQFYGAARGAAAQRLGTREFYDAIQAAAEGFNLESHGLSFSDMTQLRSAAARERRAQENFQRAPGSYAIDATMIGMPPYGRGLGEQAAMPIYSVGINLTTVDIDTGEQTTEYKQIRFTNQLPTTKDDLELLAGQDAEQLAQEYGQVYAGHSVVEIRAV